MYHVSIACVYLDVGRVSLAVPPGPRHGGEGSVRVVKLPALEVEEECCKGLLWTINRPVQFQSTSPLLVKTINPSHEGLYPPLTQW